MSAKELQDLRFKQIDSLRKHFSTVKEVSKDLIYEVPIQLPNRKMIALRINLPKEFPKHPPILQMFPPVQHRLVDSQMNVSPQAHDNLQRWTVHSDLGKTVLEIIHKFSQDPPQLLTGTSPTPNNSQAPTPLPNNLGNSNKPVSQGPQKIPVQPPVQNPTQPFLQNPIQQQSNSIGNTGFPGQVQVPQAPMKTHTPLPVVPSSFPELETKSPSELAQLLTEESEFQRFFEGLPAVQTMKKVRDDLRHSTDEIAKKLIAEEAELVRMKRDLNEKHQSVNDTRSSFEQKSPTTTRNYEAIFNTCSY